MVARTRFKYDSDFLVACALLVELAEANAHLLVGGGLDPGALGAAADQPAGPRPQC